MKDKYNREINYIRVSITDRCNLRCRYCMPMEAVERTSQEQVLSFDEIVRVLKSCVSVGIRDVKITGGEPLVRKDVPKLISMIKDIGGIGKVTLTTNGILLYDRIDELYRAGLDGINISLDTLNREKYKEITGFDMLNEVLKSMEACKKYKDLNVKLNVVTLSKYNRDEVLDFAQLAKNSKIDVRFIEMMPMGLGKTFEGYSQQEIMDRLEAEFGRLNPVSDRRGSGPAVYYEIPGFIGKIGFISAISHKFCKDCNRIRLTAQGLLKPCLQYQSGIDMRRILREETDDQLLPAIERALEAKPMQHSFGSQSIEDREEKYMSEIGG